MNTGLMIRGLDVTHVCIGDSATRHNICIALTRTGFGPSEKRRNR